MKRFFALAAVFMAFATSEVFAQPPTVSATAAVNMDVNSVPIFSKTRDMTFPVVYTGTTSATVDPVSGGAATATFNLQGPNSATMTLTYPATITLTSGLNNISVAPSVSGGQTNVQGSSSTITSGATITTAASGTTNYYFWAGGTATLSPTQATGAYSGSLTLSLAY